MKEDRLIKNCAGQLGDLKSHEDCVIEKRTLKMIFVVCVELGFELRVFGGALPLEPSPQPFLTLVVFQIVSRDFA